MNGSTHEGWSQLGVLFTLLWAVVQLFDAPTAVAQTGEELRSQFIHFIEAGDRAAAQPDSALYYYRRALAISREIEDRSGEATAIHNIGAYHFHGGRYDSALFYDRQALLIRRQLNDLEGEASTLNNIGMVHFERGQPDSALYYYQGSLGIQGELEDLNGEVVTLNNIGDVHYYHDRPDSALYYYRQALPILRKINDHPDEALTLYNIGLAYSDTGQPDSAFYYYRRSLQIARRRGDMLIEGETLNNIGVAYADSRPDSALYFYRQQLSIVQELSDSLGESSTLNNIGSVYSDIGRPDSALYFYHRALAVARKTGALSDEAITLNNIGVVHSDSRPDSALYYYRQALPIRQELSDRSGEATTLNNIGSVHSDSRPDSALYYYRQALAIDRKMKDPSGEAATIGNIGGVYLDIGQPDSALHYFRQALHAARAMNNRFLEAGTLGNIGAAYYDDSKLPEAVAYFDSSFAVTFSIGRAAGGDANRLAFTEKTAGFLYLSVLSWLRLANRVGEYHARLEALTRSERGRAQALLDLMRETTIHSSTSSTGEGNRIATTIEQTNADAALYYFSTPDTLIIWLLLPDGNGDVSLGLRRVVVSKRVLSRLVQQTRLALNLDGGCTLNPPDPGISYQEALRELARVVLPHDLVKHLPSSGELFVFPHGPLNLVPFAALPVFSGEGIEAEPLGARYALRYAPSLASLAEAEARPALGDGEARRGALRRALIVANPAMPTIEACGTTIRLSSLHATEEMLQEVASDLGAETPLKGEAATEEAVLVRLGTAPVVHLGTHGLAYSEEARARDTFVALAPSDDPALPPDRRDGRLTVGEILDVAPPLSADLVVLGACETGLGDLKEAEGTVGLQRALLARGARSALVSLWAVDEAATAHLMRSFYRSWAEEGVTKAEALRRAQEAVRGEAAHPEWSHPRYWAAFQLVGAK